MQASLLTLTGDLIPSIQIPSVLVLQPEAVETRQIPVPEGELFSNKRLDPTVSKATWFKQTEIERQADVPPVVSIQACLVYDSSDGEIDAMIVYERFMVIMENLLPRTFPNTRCLIRNFLKAQVVTPTKNSLKTNLIQPNS